MNPGGIADGQPVAPVEGAGEDSEALITPEGLHSATLQATSFSSKIFKAKNVILCGFLAGCREIVWSGTIWRGQLSPHMDALPRVPMELATLLGPDGVWYPGRHQPAPQVSERHLASSLFFLWIRRFFFGEPAPN